MEQEKVLCAEVVFPKDMQKILGIHGFTMRADKVVEWAQDEFDDGDYRKLSCTVHFFKRTQKWLDSLPEANI